MNQSEQIWNLFRKRYRKIYTFREISPAFIRKELTIPTISHGKGKIKAYQAHSSRSAWIYQPWKEGKRCYVGYEYKGIGEEGRGIRRFANTAWGGVYRKEALAEHRFSKLAFDSGVFCQRPIAIYKYGKLYGKELAVLVRSFTSPLRLSDFVFEKRFFNSYLDIRNETGEEYCTRIASTLGRNVRRLFDMGLYHGSMAMNNITTEGEIADFEPTYGGSWEGLRRTKKPYFRYMALERALSSGENIFPEYPDRFNQAFSHAFFGRKTDAYTAKKIAEKYCGVKITEKKKKKDPRILKAIKSIEEAKETTKSRKSKKLMELVLNSLKY